MTTDSRCEELEGALHLWAVEIELPHPATGEPVRVTTSEPPLFEARRKLEEAAADSMILQEWQDVARQVEERQRRHSASTRAPPPPRGFLNLDSGPRSAALILDSGSRGGPDSRFAGLLSG